MNVREYLAGKYGSPVRFALRKSEARIFGIPYPLQAGWVDAHGSIEITEEMRERLVKSLSASPKAYSASGLVALGCCGPLKKIDERPKPITKKEYKAQKLAEFLADVNSQKQVAPIIVRPDATKTKKPTKSQRKKLSRKPWRPQPGEVISRQQPTMVSGVCVTTDAFLQTYEWRRVRMMALKKYGPVCQCCGATPATGAVMNVDHIKPRKLFPQLALDVDNLQVLCHECNHGKGNWDMTDWRPAGVDQLDADSLAHIRAIGRE